MDSSWFFFPKVMEKRKRRVGAERYAAKVQEAIHSLDSMDFSYPGFGLGQTIDMYSNY